MFINHMNKPNNRKIYTVTALLMLITAPALMARKPVDKLDVTGKTFREKSRTGFSRGCEGCGNNGEFKFTAPNLVAFIWTDSDILDSGTYTQTGTQIIIQSIYGEKYEFVIEENGRVLVYVKDKSRFTIVAP